MEIEAEDVFEIGKAVVAAEAHVVAEEGQQQRVAEGLRDNREIHAGDARAKREPAEHERQCRRYRGGHEERVSEVGEPDPEPRELLPVEEDHEVRKNRVAVHAARADLAHEIHAHCVAAEREEGGMTKAQDAGVAPNQIDGERQHRITQVLADQRQRVGGQMER